MAVRRLVVKKIKPILKNFKPSSIQKGKKTIRVGNQVSKFNFGD
jgi:hypothetical protein